MSGRVLSASVLLLGLQLGCASAYDAQQQSLNQFRHSDIALGASVKQDSTTFAIWSPDTRDVKLWLDGKTYPLKRQKNWNHLGSDASVYYIKLPQNYNLVPYHFLINGKPAHDPYARMTDLNTRDPNYRQNDIVIDLAKTLRGHDFVRSPQLKHPEDAIIYETNVRDFTIDGNLSSNLQGTFSGMVKEGTRLQQTNIPSGFDHLKRLGINTVQIMPMFQFASCSIEDVQQNADCYNWGYDPQNYNVPEWRYSKYNVNGLPGQKPHYIARIKELQSMINRFHHNGMRVVMDVVYNHSANTEVFSPISNTYYLTDAAGNYIDITGTGNTINASHPMVSRMILDSLEYWVREYHVDGFRLDLMGAFDYKTVRQWRHALKRDFPQRNILFYGEPWAADNSYQGDQKVRASTIALTEYRDTHSGGEVMTRSEWDRSAIFNGNFRDALKGGLNDGSGGGFIFNQASDINKIAWGLKGAARKLHQRDPYPLSDPWGGQFANTPAETITYLTCHDNLNLWDKISAWGNANGYAGDRAHLKALDKFATAIVLTSQGTPFIQAGSEMLRSKGGDHNSYRSPDSVNQMDWHLLEKNADVVHYYRQLIKMRKQHPAFRQRNWHSIDRTVEVSYPRPGVIVSKINGAQVEDSWRKIVLIYNAGADWWPKTTQLLGSGRWHFAMHDGQPYQEQEYTRIGEDFKAQGSSVTIAYQY